MQFLHQKFEMIYILPRHLPVWSVVCVFITCMNFYVWNVVLFTATVNLHDIYTIANALFALYMPSSKLCLCWVENISHHCQLFHMASCVSYDHFISHGLLRNTSYESSFQHFVFSTVNTKCKFRMTYCAIRHRKCNSIMVYCVIITGKQSNRSDKEMQAGLG